MRVYGNDAKIVKQHINMINEFKDINTDTIILCKKCIENNLFDDAYKILDNVAKSIDLVSNLTINLIDHYIKF